MLNPLYKPKTTTPVKTEEDLAAIKQQLLYHFPKYGIRNYLIFCLGIHIGIRAGDLLTIRLRDIFDFTTTSVKTSFLIVEEKTNKINELYLAQDLIDDLNSYILTLPTLDPDQPLFPSRKQQPKRSDRSINRLKNGRDDTGCLDVSSYGRILREIGKSCGITHLCTHSMRKTYGYSIVTSWGDKLIGGQFRPIDYVQHRFNHSKQTLTLGYIDIGSDIHKMVAEHQVR